VISRILVIVRFGFLIGRYIWLKRLFHVADFAFSSGGTKRTFIASDAVADIVEINPPEDRWLRPACRA
jgi:hypothetical protein